MVQGPELAKEHQVQGQKPHTYKNAWTNQQKKAVKPSKTGSKTRGKKQTISDMRATKTLQKGDIHQKLGGNNVKQRNWACVLLR